MRLEQVAEADERYFGGICEGTTMAVILTDAGVPAGRGRPPLAARTTRVRAAGTHRGGMRRFGSGSSRRDG